MLHEPGQFPPVPDNVISAGSLDSIGLGLINLNRTSFVSAAWPTANLAIYIPFVLRRDSTLYQVGWMNGATTVTGTREVGVYTAAGSKVISGAATGATATVVQRVDVADTTLAAGQYWLAITNTDTTNWYGIAPTAPECAALGILTQATANPLPATATMALNNTLAFVPLGFLQLRSAL